MIEASELHGWVKPKYGIDGTWVTDGKIAVRVEGTNLPPPRAPFDGRKFLDEMVATAATPVESFRRINGRVVAGESIFAEHFVALVEAAHPGCAWRTGGDAMLAFVNDEAVAIVMRRRDTDAQLGEPLAPDCATCEGHGGRECSRCEGSKQITVTCPECDEEHEHDCPRCEGVGYVDRCATCDGTGAWKPEHDAARLT